MSGPPRPQATVSTDILMRIVIGLLAVWDAVAGLVLVASHAASAGALGAGVEDEAGKRLLGAHLLVLVPVYLLLAIRLDRYLALVWLPIAAQAAVVLVIGYNMLQGDTSFGNGILAFAVSLIFLVLMGFLWITERRVTARLQMEQGLAGLQEDSEDPLSGGSEGGQFPQG
jgi:hypothetical protein